jgi:hypothetical protein
MEYLPVTPKGSPVKKSNVSPVHAYAKWRRLQAEGSAMNDHTLNRRIEALLDDPIVALMIHADGVDRAGLARQIRALGQPVEKTQIRDKKPRPVWRALSPVLYGACAP